jgi:hypothetical protein
MSFPCKYEIGEYQLMRQCLCYKLLQAPIAGHFLVVMLTSEEVLQLS